MFHLVSKSILSSRFRILCPNKSQGKKWAICMTSYALILFPIRIPNGYDVVKFWVVDSTIVIAFSVQLFRLRKKSVECRKYPVFRSYIHTYIHTYFETTLWKRFRDSCSVCSKQIQLCKKCHGQNFSEVCHCWLLELEFDFQFLAIKRPTCFEDK